MPTTLEKPPPQQTRYVEPEQAVDEPVATHYAMAISGLGGLFVLLGLFFFSTVHMLHGWWWGLFAVPAVLLAAAAAAGLKTLEQTR